ncbi:MAG TPA: gluconate 2-dehydrogenase subunit 3 family protein [Gemmatimonadaceae bacterium]|nr:gluconate 2-dehydrogenase subunit 3 family protein [Gemmatimonadaceae bacterium]
MSNQHENPERDASLPEENTDAAPDTLRPEPEVPGKEISRRDAVQLLAALPIAAFLSWPTAEQEKVRRFVDNALGAAAEGIPYAPKFFTPAEFRTARILADMIIPRDERSGNASDAGVPEFMDFTMNDRPNSQKWMRDGLAWIDAQSKSRFGKAFADATQSQREAILNDIAWPARAKASMADGVGFFNRFRDLTATGFWSSQIGVKDLKYQGNTFAVNWNGCPPAALQKLGVTYAKFDRKKLRLTPE